MDGKKPLLVCIEDNGGIQVVESETKKGTYVARGLFAKGDVETANKRVYPSTILKREIDKLSEDIKSRKIMGELDHPFDGKTKLSRTSHIITNLSIDDKGNVVGEAEILDTQKGKDLKAILEGGGAVGVSSRGFGSVKKVDGRMLVQDDFSLQTFDFVANPAQKEAYPGIFMEAEGSTPVEMEAKLENVERDFPHLYDEMRERIRLELKGEIDEAVEKRVSEQKLLIEEETRRKLTEDTSGDKGKKSVAVLDEITKLVRPLIDESVKADNVVKMEGQISELKSALNEATGYAKVAGYNLLIERELSGVVKEDRDTIVSIVGDIERFDNLDSLKVAIKAAKDKISAITESRERLVSEKNGMIEDLSDKVSELENSLKAVRKELASSRKVQEVRERLHDNPLVEEAVVRAESGEDVDDIISEISSKHETDDLVESVQRVKHSKRRDDMSELTEASDRPFKRNGKYANSGSPSPLLEGDLLQQTLEINRRLMTRTK